MLAGETFVFAFPFEGSEPARAALKALGARFDRTDRTWRLCVDYRELTVVETLAQTHGFALEPRDLFAQLQPKAASVNRACEAIFAASMALETDWQPTKPIAVTLHL
jgi:hypothetical protein